MPSVTTVMSSARDTHSAAMRPGVQRLFFLTGSVFGVKEVCSLPRNGDSWGAARSFS